MTADPKAVHDQEDATNAGVSSTEPAEGADDAPAGGAGAPDGVTVGETADER